MRRNDGAAQDAAPLEGLQQVVIAMPDLQALLVDPPGLLELGPEEGGDELAGKER